jgi:hypothetical protein
MVSVQLQARERILAKDQSTVLAVVNGAGVEVQMHIVGQVAKLRTDNVEAS